MTVAGRVTEEYLEILEAALKALTKGIAVLDGESQLLLWNDPAAAISGYTSADLVGRVLPADFFQVDAHHRHEAASVDTGERALLMSLRHRQGHALPVLLHRTTLRNALGKRFGTLLRFHPVEEIDALPHGDSGDDDSFANRLEQSQAGLEDRLDVASREWTANAIPFGLLWINVDQALALRKTHGNDASEAMLVIVERTLLHGLRPTEIMGRWGSNEFLVLCHERTAEMLEAHALHLAGLARTADFRWWGDRISLTISVGAAQAADAESLSCVLKRAQAAMKASAYGGGNQVTSRANSQEASGARGPECSQS